MNLPRSSSCLQHTKMKLLPLIAFASFLVVIQAVASENVSKSPMNDEHRLLQDIMSTYGKKNLFGRPVQNVSEAITVKMGVSLQQILNVDEKNSVLTLQVWMNFEWKDNYLRWDPLEYGGVRSIRMAASDIWSPDITLYNSVNVEWKPYQDTWAVINNDGMVLWVPPAILKSTCLMDLSYFPFDEQNCRLKFGSRTYDNSKLDLILAQDSMDLTTYSPNLEWELMEAPAVRNEVRYDCCPESYVELSYLVWLKRRTREYGSTMLFLCVVLSLLTLFNFLLPSQSHNRHLLGLFLLLAFLTLLLASLAGGYLPHVTTSMLETYLGLSFICVALSIFSAGLIQIQIGSDDTKGLPNLLKKILIDIFGCVLLVTVCSNEPGDRINPSDAEGKGSSPSDPGSVIPLSESKLQSDTNHLSGIRAMLKSCLERMDYKQSVAKNKREWTLVGKVVDRILFLAYLIVLLVLLCVVFSVVYGY